MALENPATHTILCRVCAVSNTNKWPISTTTKSKPGAFPSALQQKHNSEIQIMDLEGADTWPVTAQACAECKNPEMYFREMQLRGADEGTTIFYRCPKCNYMTKSDN